MYLILMRHLSMLPQALWFILRLTNGCIYSGMTQVSSQYRVIFDLTGGGRVAQCLRSEQVLYKLCWFTGSLFYEKKKYYSLVLSRGVVNFHDCSFFIIGWAMAKVSKSLVMFVAKETFLWNENTLQRASAACQAVSSWRVFLFIARRWWVKLCTSCTAALCPLHKEVILLQYENNTLIANNMYL